MPTIDSGTRPVLVTHPSDCTGWVLLRDDPKYGEYHERCKHPSHNPRPTLFDQKES